MSNYENDTIAAIATAPGEGGIGIVRVSGCHALDVADTLFSCSPPLPSQRAANTFVHGVIRNEKGVGSDLDEAILLIYRSPRSYTTEDVVEFQCHGGITTLTHLLRRTLDVGCRLAEPGEFTKRAFINGRIDLIQAEAVMDLIQAKSDRAAAVAVEQLEGRLSGPFETSYDQLMALAADLEATLDFSEEELPDSLFASLLQRLIDVHSTLQDLLSSWDEGRLLRHGARVVIAGQPNVGKSTLLNALLGHGRAIVTSTAGTTRDTIEESMLINGYPIELIDTAGLRDTMCDIEQEGIARARQWIDRADLTIWVFDVSQPIDKEVVANIDEGSSILVLNKCDLTHTLPPVGGPGLTVIPASLTLGQGTSELRSALIEKLGLVNVSSSHATISERHHSIIKLTLNELNECRELLATDDPESSVLVATRLRDALEILGTATGRIYSDSLLDAIFSRFCVGK